MRRLGRQVYVFAPSMLGDFDLGARIVGRGPRKLDLPHFFSSTTYRPRIQRSFDAYTELKRSGRR